MDDKTREILNEIRQLPEQDQMWIAEKLMDSVKEIGARVEITLLPTESGGRKGPPPKEWHCVIRVGQAPYDARLYFSEEPPNPGSSADARIRLLSPELIWEVLPLGQEFEVWEGDVVGHGVVISHGKQKNR